MKVSLLGVLAVFTAQSALAFAPLSCAQPRTLSSLYLFGGGDKKEGGADGKGGGMMNQLAMFKKAQEVAQKKKKLDEELASTPFEIEVADGKVKAQFKYVPVMNPMDPNPDYQALKFEFDDEYFASATAEDISKACEEAVIAGMKEINEAVAKKYETLQKDLMEALGSAGGGAASAAE